MFPKLKPVYKVYLPAIDSWAGQASTNLGRV